MANILPGSLDYTDKDFDSVKDRLIKLIGTVFPTWTDHNVANFGNVLLESQAFVADLLGFYQDNQANEAFLPSTQQRKNAIALAKMINFEAEGAAAAQVDVTLTARDTSTGGPPVGNVSIPAETIVQTAEVTDPVRFQLLTAATIAAASDPSTDTVTAENSANAEDNFVSSGVPNQEFVLTSIPYLDDSAVINAGDGTYTEVDTFLSSTSSDKHFVILVDENDRATVRFGNGVNGKVPIGNVAVTYKTGGGAVGAVEEGAVSQIQGQFTDDLSNPVTVTVTNAASSSGAQDRQTVDQIRIAAPASLRVLERTVAREDFEICADQIAGVARSLMLTSDQSEAIPENTGFLFIIPEGGGVPSTALKDEVAAIFVEQGEKPSTLTFVVDVRDPLYLSINVEATIFPDESADLDPTSDNYIKTLIVADLESYFAISNADGTPNEKIGFGFDFKDGDGNPAGEIPKSDIFNIVRDNAFVRKMSDKITGFLLNGGTTDVDLEPREFPQLGTVTLINGDTGIPL